VIRLVYSVCNFACKNFVGTARLSVFQAVRCDVIRFVVHYIGTGVTDVCKFCVIGIHQVGFI
jgi:hypothetical protein